MADMSHIKTFLTSVQRVTQVTPMFCRITFGGGDLGEFECISPDQFLYLLLPPPGRTELTIDRDFKWADVPQMPEAERPVGAYYTVREHRAEVAELDIDVLVHEPLGHASAWARAAQPGDVVALWGPRKAYEPPEDTAWQLLVGDETAVPAIASILRDLPPGMRAIAIIEVADAREEQPLPSRGDVEVRWLHRDGAEAGRTDLVLDALEGLELPAGRGYAWGGGEVTMINRARRFLRQRGLGREATSLIGYWHHREHEGVRDERDD